MATNTPKNIKDRYSPATIGPALFACRSIVAVIAFVSTLVVWMPAGIGADAPMVEIGVIVAQSGKAQSYGHAAIQGAQLAVDEINEKGAAGKHRLTLVVFDNKSTALNSREAATRAVHRRVAGVVGAVWSTHSLAVARVLQSQQIPMISPGSTAPGVTLTGDYIFRTSYTDEFQGKLMAEFAYRSTNHRRAAVLTNFSETYSKTLARFFASNFEGIGGDIIYEAGYKGSAIDYKDILMPMQLLNPEVVFIPGYSQDSGLIIKQARKLGINSVFMGGDAWETNVAQFGGHAMEGSYFSTFWHPNLPFPRNRKFLARYKSTHGRGPMSAYGPLAYDAVWLLADAMRRSKSADPERIRDALAATQDFEGATGIFNFNAFGDPVNKGASILKYNLGQWVFFKAFEPQ